MVTLGSFASGALARAAGFFVGWSMGGLGTGAACAVAYFVCGIVIGSIPLAIISGSVKTILVCWVDSPETERLAQGEKHGEIGTELVSRISVNVSLRRAATPTGGGSSVPQGPQRIPEDLHKRARMEGVL